MKGIIVDSTHNTASVKNIKLTIITVLDSKQISYPVAYCISNKEDEKTIEIFFKIVYNNLNVNSRIKITTLITDDTLVYINAARRVFPNLCKHYLCLWHVEKNFKKHIKSDIILTDKEQQKQISNNVLKILQLIMTTNNKEEADNLVDNLKQSHRLIIPEFINYWRNITLIE